MPPAPQSAAALRRLLLALVAFGMVALSVELVLLEHYEDPLMFVPFAVLGAGLAAVVLHATAGTSATARLLQTVMVVVIVSGLVGIGVHYQGSLEFQVEMDPEIARWDLFWKVMHMKAPPTLAPGAMVQLGLLGLLATYGHAAAVRQTPDRSTGEHT